LQYRQVAFEPRKVVADVDAKVDVDVDKKSGPSRHLQLVKCTPSVWTRPVSDATKRQPCRVPLLFRRFLFAASARVRQTPRPRNV
jgi:hypothetical protein